MRPSIHAALMVVLAFGSVTAVPTESSSLSTNPLPPPSNSLINSQNAQTTTELDSLAEIESGASLEKLDKASCTDQEVDCGFMRSASSYMQNEDDDCIKIASHFELGGKGMVSPLVQDDTTVVFGITTDAQPTSAWCNDIGWALRRIYSSCRRGRKCYGGNLAAARNPEFLVAVGPRVEGGTYTPDNSTTELK